MKKLILITLLVATMGFAQQQGAPASKAKKLTRDELDKLLATPDRVLLIDVRRPDEITANGGFPVYLSIQAGDLKNHLSEIPKDRMIVVVSNHAARASVAADLLEKNGFNVAGAVGAEVYESEGGTLTKIKPLPPPQPAAK